MLRHLQRKDRVGARRLMVLVVLVGLLALLLPGRAQAGKHSMIPPGQEQAIRDFVETGLAPAELEQPVDLTIDRDRILVDTREPEGPRFVIVHPEVDLDDGDEPLAPGVGIHCGPPTDPRPCRADERDRWREVAEALARARDPVAAQIWVIEETSPSPDAVDHGDHPSRTHARAWVDQLAAVLAAALGLGLAIWAGLDRRHHGRRIHVAEWLALATLLLATVALTCHFTPLLPLHEHNSFVARSDCAIDDRCVDDPVGAWSPTAFHGYQLLLSAIPYQIPWLSRLSLALSLLDLILLWALTRTVMTALGRPRLAPFAGLSAVAILAVHPVFWRLAGSASFWPWSLVWMLGALLAGLWAGQLLAARGETPRGEEPAANAEPGGRETARGRIVAGVLAWLLAATCLSFAAGGNFVCLTLGILLGLAPLCWTRWRAASLPALAGIAAPASGLFAVVVGDDYLQAIRQLLRYGDLGAHYDLQAILAHFAPLFLRPQVSTWIWALPLLLSAAWLLPPLAARAGPADEPGPIAPLRILLPLLAAWMIPGAFLGVAAGELIGSGYPVGFINHHWALVFTAALAGLGLAWLVGVLARWRPERSWGLLLLPLLLLAAITTPREGWRMATGERVNERELLALQASFAALPAHDVLVIAPRLQDPIAGAPRQGDPIEIAFPIGAYAHALRQHGRAPARIVAGDAIPELAPDERALIYVGAALRSFQYAEIEAAVIPGDLERPVLTRVRERWALEPAHTFMIRTDQHEAIITRLAADRVPERELGFYWLRPR